MVVVYMDRAQGPTVDFFTQNLRGTHTSSAESSVRRYVAAALLGPGHAAMAPRNERRGRRSRIGDALQSMVLCSCVGKTDLIEKV